VHGVSLSRAFAATVAGLTGIAVLVIGALWVASESARFARDSDALRREYYDAQGELVRTEVERVIDAIEYQHSQLESALERTLRLRVDQAHAIAAGLYEAESGRRPRTEVERIVKEALRPIRFDDGRGFFFVTSRAGVGVLYPVAPELEGRNLLDLADDQGRFPVRTELELLAREPAGFVRDHRRRPGAAGEMVHPKLTYVRRFDPLGWYLGTGEYLDDFERDVQEDILARVASVRFGTEGYVFINTFDGDALITDGRRVTDGANLWELADPNGVKVIQEERRAAEQPEGGFIHYTWRKLTSNELAPKVSFIKGYRPWRWMVGAGVYLDEIEPIVAARRVELRRSLRSHLLLIAATVVALGLLVGLVAGRFSRRSRRSIEAFEAFFSRAADENATIDEGQLHFTEFRRLATSANAMVASRRRAEAETARLQEQLAQARKMEALGLLAGGVAHDLNNILSGLVMYPDLMLLDLPKDSPLRSQVEGIKASGQRAAAVVADLLAASRGGRGPNEVVDPNRVVAEYLGSPEHLKLAAAHPEIRVECELDPGCLNLSGTRSRLGKALMNLVANGFEAIAGRGRVLIATATRTLRQTHHGFDSVPPGEYVVVSVSDSGSGIRATDLERIFEPFFTRKILGRTGTGLGLTVVWHTVKGSEGYIDVYSGPAGTRFDLYFPAVRETADGDPPPPPADALRGAGERVLVVDDEPMQRQIAEELLSRLGYAPSVAASGEAAVDMVARAAYDLVILDMIMEPGMSGRETYEAILARRPGQRALIVSGYAETEDIHATLELGACGSVLKPYTIEQLGRAVRRALGPAPAQDAGGRAPGSP